MRIALVWVREKSSKFFHRFGIHCATHQIRLILISGLVITSLFYPALEIYSTSKSKPLSNLPVRVFGSVFAPEYWAPSLFEDDLSDVWTGHKALKNIEDPVARAKCGIERTIRIERVLITTDGFDSDTGVINPRMLLSALRLEQNIAEHLFSAGLDCLTSPSQHCVTLSPVEFWSHDEHAIRSDSDLLQTINSNRNISVAGLPLKASMVLSGRESSEPHGSSIDFAAFLAITYFFNEDDCNGSASHNAWIKVLSDVVSSFGDVTFKVQEPLLLAFEFNTETRSSRRISLITVTLYISYIIFFVYFSGSMRRMDTVHSRVGLCFTGLVEIIVSTITSLSVCALGGLRITMVPWGIFPIVIVFVGAENMFRLIDDVVKTPITLPVKERIGLGLSRAGTSNTLKVVSYNAILGVIGFFAQGAIRQFCVFAIVVLVAHWFLIHTFFVAVLSIDIQRLELDDLLRQDSSIGPFDSKEKEKAASKVVAKSLPPYLKVMRVIRQVTKGRVTKNVSLLLLLTITSTLYYSTLPSSTHLKSESPAPTSRASFLHSKAEQTKLEMYSESRQMWRTLNPQNDPLLHLRIEAPAIITLDRRFGDTEERRSHRSRWPTRSLKSLWWIFKVMVLPIGATLSGLYILLLNLLRGTDRLEGQRGYTELESDLTSMPIEGRVAFRTLPRAFATDVGLLASNDDCSLVASVSSTGELFLWFSDSRKYVEIDTTDLLSRSASSSSKSVFVSAVAVDGSGTYCAVGTYAGIIEVWNVSGGTAIPMAHLFIGGDSSTVTQLEFCPPQENSEDRTPEGEINGSALVHVHNACTPCILAIYDNGNVVQWFDGNPVFCRPSRHDVLTAIPMRLPDLTHPLIGYIFDSGLEVVDIRQELFNEEPLFFRVGSSEDRLVGAHACLLSVEGTPHLLVAAVTSSGVITIWDGKSGICIYTLDDTYGSVNELRLLPAASKACPQCGEVPLCSFDLVYSVGHVIVVDHGILARRCSCPLSQPLVPKATTVKDSAMGRRSRSGSFVSSSGTESLVRSRSRQVSFSNELIPVDVSAFPVSGHGAHSRRGTEKENSRRGSDKFDRFNFTSFEDRVDADDHSSLTVPEASRRNAALDNPDVCLWRNFRLVRAKEMTCERGGWDLLGSKVLGLRRKPRERHSPSSEVVRPHVENVPKSFLSSSVLDRWEVWLFDPGKADGALRASSLSALVISSDSDEVRSGVVNQKPIPRLSFTRLSPLVVKSSFCLAGFGNTVGIICF